jgi:peptidoglycan-associated lipoprotein
MKLQLRIVMLSALAITVGLSGCDSGPGTSKIQATQAQTDAQAEAPSTPAVETTPAAEPVALGELKDAHFDLDQAKIRSGEGRMLRDHARWLKSNQNATVTIGGHADERGSEEYNLRLGERRANAVRAYLIARGVEADRVTVTSHGERSPACSDHTESCWSQNRRAEFQVQSR